MEKRKGQNSDGIQTRETKKVITIKNKRLMRKSNLVLIAAAASMLASCGKDLILDNSQDAQAPIGFASYSEKEAENTLGILMMGGEDKGKGASK